ncbi:hypothetical protein JCM16161A_08290 [Vulcanisaeta sp. JCM 16161]|uniref:hypothetical protein n=1 Tax=Vulcanisaeta sp. JCM 16161 TaxID=1295372 RepID=UPI00406CC6E9
MDNVTYFYLDKLYNSDRIKDLVSFYEKLRDINDALEWVKRRPRAEPRIYEVPGDTEIVVIVPTADHDGIYARNIKEIFRGLHIIFVESRGPYFSYSYSCNAGFKYALKKYKPKWFILSNDDMIMEDPPDKIKQELSVINERNIATVFTNPPGIYHSIPSYLIQFKKPYELLYSLYISSSCKCKIPNFYQKFHIRYGAGVFIKGSLFNKIISSIALSNIAVKRIKKYLLIGSFGIFSRYFVEKYNGNIFDNNYLVTYQDFDLSINIAENEKYDFINYKIQDIIGGTLGTGPLRSLKSLIDIITFNYKITNGIIKISHNYDENR